MDINSIVKGVGLGSIAVLALAAALGSFYTVDQGERAVLLRNGAIVGVERPGLHLKTPWIEAVHQVDVQTRNQRYSKVNSYSQDQQPADIAISVTYHVDPEAVATLYSRFGTVEAMEGRLLTPHVLQEFKVVFGRYSAVRAIQERAKLNADVFTAIRDSMAGDPELVLESIQVENIDLSSQYVQSIEQRMQAEIEVQRIGQQFQQQEVQAKITIVNAQAAADARIAAAKADAQAIQLRGEAEAAAIKARGDALKQNLDLVALTAAERWDGKLPATMVPGSTVPFIGVK